MLRLVSPASPGARAALPLLCLALLAPVVAVAAPDAAAVRLPWDGFGEGSTVHLKTTTEMGFPGVPPQTSEQRQTLVKITPEQYLIKHETKVGEQWMGSETPYPRKVAGATRDGAPEAKPEDLGTEAVAVEGKEYACKKMRYVVGGFTTTTWTHEKEGVLRNETKGTGAESSMVVTRLAFKATVAGKELEVRETTMTSKAMGSETKIRSWESRAVPGGTVRTEMVAEMAGMKTTTRTEVVAFEAK